MINKKTKIICTIGPASEKIPTLKKMISAGMNAARLNFSHGDYPGFTTIIHNIRAASKALHTPVAIIQDLQGPKIRVGEMPLQGIFLKKNSIIILTTKNIRGSDTLISVQYKNFHKDVKKNDRILLNDGLMELKVRSIKGRNITCKVITGGQVFSHKGINVPTASIQASPLTSKDIKDLIFGLKHDVDYVALSFVENAKNIEELRSIIRRLRGRAKIIAKIERHEAVENMEEIIHEADAVMVARGDLGTEISPERVPLIQKKIIHLANLHGKPVITATEMLQSMVENARATRAEISDVANAIFDHTDAVMLSNESAIGKYPITATLTLAKVAASTEQEIKKHQQFLPNRLFKGNQPVSYATCSAAAELAVHIKAKMIVAATFSGFTAQHLAKHRIYIPMVVVTADQKIQQQLALTWGIDKVFIKNFDQEKYAAQIHTLLVTKKLVKKGDTIVVVSNTSEHQKSIKIVTI